MYASFVGLVVDIEEYKQVLSPDDVDGNEYQFMTASLYSEAFSKACTTFENEPNVLKPVKAVYDAHLLHVTRVELKVQELKKEPPSAQKEAALNSFKHQQDVSHMKTSVSVEEFYRTALSQAETSVSMFMFLSTSVALESRMSFFEMQKEILLATSKKSEEGTSRAPLRIVKLLFEGTSTQHELKSLIRLWIPQNPIKFVGMSEEQFLQEICSYPWKTNSSASEKVLECFLSFPLCFCLIVLTLFSFQ